MKNVKTLPEFEAYSELEVNAALDAYDDSVEEEHSSCGGCESAEPAGDDEGLSGNPIVDEVFRLIRAYTDRMNELVDAEKAAHREISESFLADMLSYEPAAPIERIAFDFVADAIMDDDDGSEEN